MAAATGQGDAQRGAGTAVSVRNESVYQFRDAPPPPAAAPGEAIVVLRRGGLGNQLFQHAAAIAGSRARGVRVFYTRSDDVLRAKDPQLEDLVGALPEATSLQLAGFLRPPAWTPRPAVMWARRLRWRFGIGRPVWRLADGIMEQVERPFWGTGLLYDGLFQAPSSFEPGLAEVVAQVLQRRPAWAVRRDDVTAVNFRTAADFRSLGWVLPWKYYDAALERVDPERRRAVWPIGDERATVDEAVDRLRLAGWRVESPEGHAAHPGVNDFWNLARAGSLVMSTSTFTWWAAVVGDAMAQDASRLVTCPTPWQPPENTLLRRAAWLAVEYHGAHS